ncbi:MAG: 5-oxoprolinase/urea amidolyase family protein [Sandaracinaceae bacterium]
MSPALSLEPFGPDAIRLALAEAWADDIGGRVALARAIEGIEGVRDAIVTEGHALALLDGSVASSSVCARLGACLSSARRAPLGPAREHLVETHYDGADLDGLAAELGLARDDVIALHTGAPLVVSFLGFLPGFAYLRGLPPALADVPRRASPRPRVPPRSVAIAGGMSAVYPAASPGGWQLLGHATGFDPLERALSPGDRVQFVAVDAHTSVAGADETAALDGALVVTRAVGPALVVDGAPRRRLALGTPPGGPLVHRLARRANASVGNPADAALVERYGRLTLSLRAGDPPRALADEHGRVTTLRPGHTRTFEPPRGARVGYVAVEGGIDVPEVLGGRGTLLAVARGGLCGRALRTGDRLPLGSAGSGPAQLTDEELLLRTGEPDAPLLLHVGPDLLDLERASTRLATTRFRIDPASDRTGVRLVPEHRLSFETRAARTSPMRVGAVQAPPSGELVVLGPDHPVTGGYPVVGILPPTALEALFARPVGSFVCLRLLTDR